MSTLRVQLLLVAATLTTSAQTPLPNARSVEPIGAIIQAFQTHAIVALGNVEFRGNEQSHAFQAALIRDPKFARVVNDIVVEFGNARYQDVVDRFVDGADVPQSLLQQVWRNTSQFEFEWDLPIYEDFFRTVRAVNSTLPKKRRLRIVLGDPPVDWEKVRSLADLEREMGDRDQHAVMIVQREVLDRGRKALIIYGGQHLIRKNTVPDAVNDRATGIVAMLERDATFRAFTILPETRRDLTTIQADVASWAVPSLALLQGTVVGAARWSANPRARAVRWEEQADAILYLGPPGGMTMSKLAPALCADKGYMEMRLGRLALAPAPPGAVSPPVAQLKSYCAGVNSGK